MLRVSTSTLDAEAYPLGTWGLPFTFPTGKVWNTMERDYSGMFRSLFWKKNSRAAINTWYDHYKSAQSVYNYPRYSGVLADDEALINHMVSVTGSPRQELMHFMATLKKLATKGEMDTKYWDLGTYLQTKKSADEKRHEEKGKNIFEQIQTAGTWLVYGTVAVVLFRLYSAGKKYL